MSDAVHFTRVGFRKVGDTWQRHDTATKRWATLYVDKTVVPYVWTWKA